MIFLIAKKEKMCKEILNRQSTLCAKSCAEMRKNMEGQVQIRGNLPDEHTL